MGIFSFFGKKHGHSAAGPAVTTPVRDKSGETPFEDGQPIATPGRNAQHVTERNTVARQQRQAALETALKIDEIESEMSSEFAQPIPREPVAVMLAATPSAIQNFNPAPEMPLPAIPTDSLSLGNTIIDATALEDVSLFEEAAVLFANGQLEIVEHLLKEALNDDSLGLANLTAWAMLFDLYQINGNRVEFEHLSIAYASHFKSSPPAWIPLALSAALHGNLPRAPAVPSVVFGGKLDAGIIKLLEKARSLAQKHPTIRLEFTRVMQVDPVGCGLLLHVLAQLRKSDIDIMLVGAPDLIVRIRAILVVGRRDETETPWLLMLELLGMLNLETAFEETSIDYCVTFEVSPPAFVAPKGKIIPAVKEAPAVSANADVFIMPALIEGRADALVLALRQFVSQHNPACIDCALLARVDVNAAGQLQAGLMSVSGDGRVIELINVNYLVAALLNMVGLKNFVHIATRKIGC